MNGSAPVVTLEIQPVKWGNNAATAVALPIEERISDNNEVIYALVKQNLEILKKNVFCLQEQENILNMEQIALLQDAKQLNMLHQEGWSIARESVTNAMHAVGEKVQVVIDGLNHFKEGKKQHWEAFFCPEEKRRQAFIDLYKTSDRSISVKVFLGEVVKTIGALMAVDHYLHSLQECREEFKEYKGNDTLVSYPGSPFQENTQRSIALPSSSSTAVSTMIDDHLPDTREALLGKAHKLEEKVFQLKKENALLSAKIDSMKREYVPTVRAYYWCVFIFTFDGVVKDLEEYRDGISLKIQDTIASDLVTGAKEEAGQEILSGFRDQCRLIQSDISCFIDEVKKTAEYFKNLGRSDQLVDSLRGPNTMILTPI